MSQEIDPPLTVVVATRQPWPEVRLALDSFHTQARALGAEIIVMDGLGEGLPPDHGYDGVSWLKRPGKTVLQLRAEGLRVARGAVVALTEDHCRVAPDWCARVLEAHAEQPEAAIIGGAIENGACAKLVDWANFFISNGPFLPPVPDGEGAPITGQANVSYKRWALRDYPEDALHEGAFRADLRQRGFPLRNDDRLRVEHVQSLGALASCLIHFHDGRCVAASRRPLQSPARRAFELVKGALLPLRVAVASARVIKRTVPTHRSLAFLSGPWIVLVMGFHAAGELVGLVAGEGDSPAQMR